MADDPDPDDSVPDDLDPDDLVITIPAMLAKLECRDEAVLELWGARAAARRGVVYQRNRNAV